MLRHVSVCAVVALGLAIGLSTDSGATAQQSAAGTGVIMDSSGDFTPTTQ